MNYSKTFPKRYYFVQFCLCLLVCCLFFKLEPLATTAGPKGKALGRNKHGGSPHGNFLNSGVLKPINAGVNPAGIITGTGGIKISETGPTTFNTGAVMNPGNIVTGTGGSKTYPVQSKGQFVKGPGQKVFFAQPSSNVLVKINSLAINGPAAKNFTNWGKMYKAGPTLGAGDAFFKAIGKRSCSTSSLTVPDVIGAKGPNPVHGGRHLKKYNVLYRSLPQLI